MVAPNVTIRINIGTLLKQTMWNQHTYITQISPTHKCSCGNVIHYQIKDYIDYGVHPQHV